jgi:hypothetical protein
MNVPRDPKSFQRRQFFDQPELVGARWWNEALERAPDDSTRRQVMIALAAAGGFAGLVILLNQLPGRRNDEVQTQMEALALQRREGWDVGEAGTPITIPFASLTDVDGE